MRLGTVASTLVLALLAGGAGACVQRPRMCVAPTECGATAACVSGRCLPNNGVPAIQSARRMVVDPVDVAFLRPGAAAGDAVPRTFTMGAEGTSGAVLYLRFSVPLPKDANVLEAYLLIDRSDAVDVDPQPITLHAARIVEPWDGRYVSWLDQPRVEDTRSPSTTITPARPLVRVDVRDLVQRWRTHDPKDQGIALLAEGTSKTGQVFALTAATENGSERMGPRLELYVK